MDFTEISASETSSTRYYNFSINLVLGLKHYSAQLRMKLIWLIMLKCQQLFAFYNYQHDNYTIV